MKIAIPFAGSVIVDCDACTLQASSVRVGQKLLVGFTADTTDGLAKGRLERQRLERQAGGGIFWQWLDHNGLATDPQ